MIYIRETVEVEGKTRTGAARLEKKKIKDNINFVGEFVLKEVNFLSK